MTSSAIHRRSVRALVACLLGLAAWSALPGVASARQIKLTGEITAIGQPDPAGTHYSLKFRLGNKVVGRTLRPLSCNAGLGTEIECSGGPIHLQEIRHTFWLSRILWNIPTCINANQGCPKGDRKATGQLAAGPNPLNPLAKQPRQIGTITVNTTSSFGNKLHRRFKVTLKL